MNYAMSRQRRGVLMAAVAVCAMGMPAWAQSSGAGAPEEVSANDASSGVGDIIVTAQRRKERLQDVPISIQAVSGAALEAQGIQNSRDLTSAVPGLNFTVKGAFVQPALRGITSQGSGAGLDTAVPIYLDGVYVANTIATIFELSDISGIEVLKGPQGTLYGRNATGGAILITTKVPSFDFTGNIIASYGNYDEKRASSYISGPIVADKIAFSLSGYYRERDGYTKDLVRGGKVGEMDGHTLRGKLLFAPVDGVEFTVTGMHSYLSDPATLYGIAAGGNSLSKRVAPTLPIATKPWTATVNIDPQILKNKIDSVNLNGTIETGAGDLTTVTAYQKSLARVAQDADLGPGQGLSFTYRFPNKSFSQELSLVSRKMGAFSFIVGGAYYQQTATGNLVANLVSDILGRQKAKAYAAYGELTVEPVENFTIVGGLRYSHERRSYVGRRRTPPAAYTVVATGEKSWNDLTPRITAKYQVTSALNIYATYNEAFKSGAFNPSGLSPIPVNPEKVKAYEAGIKFASRGIRINAAAFRYDYKDLQVASTVTQPNGTTASVLQNAASARIKGFDLDASFELTPAFRLSGGFAYVDANYRRFPTATANVPFAASLCPAGTFPCGNTAVVLNASGNPVARSPKFTGNITAEYRGRLANGDLILSSSLYHNSGFSWEVADRVREKAYQTLAANLMWRPDDSGLEFSIYGRNLTNEAYAVSEADSAGGDAIAFAMPRTYGVQVKYSF